MVSFKFVLLLVAAVFCHNAQALNPEAKKAFTTVFPARSIPQVRQPLAERFNEFDWNLTKGVGEKLKDNFVLSPISVKLVLAMLYEGANGKTAKELEDALQISRGVPVPRTADRFSSILQSLKASSPSYDLDIGMKLFMDHKSAPKKTFEKRIFDLYNATIDRINFSNTSAAVALINSWAESVTRGHIQHLVSEADTRDSTVLLLLNAVYFKGLWEYPFPVNNTIEGSFTTGPLTTVPAHFMSAVHTVQYVESEDLKASIIRLPYQGGKFAMYLILPDDKNGIDDMIASITPAKVFSLISEQMVQIPVQVILPKFKFEYAATLAPILQKLGIREMFSNGADLLNIAEGPKDLVVSNVIQKAGIDVNELGTEAYVTTVAELVNKFGSHTVVFNASHPFIFFIRDEAMDTVVFVGKVVNPVSRGHPEVNAAPPSPVPPPAHFLPSAISNKIDVPELSPFYYFDIQLAKELGDVENSNWVASPSSIKTTLGLLLEAADGNTAAEICRVLRLSHNLTLAREDLWKMQLLLQRTTPNIQLKSYSNVLIRKGINVSPSFSKKAVERYAAPVNSVDFSNPAVVAKNINSWVKQVTQDLISEIITEGSITANSVVVLVNAVHFKGDWKQEFNPHVTQSACFYSPTCKKVQMMTTSGSFRYGIVRNLNSRIIELPYKNRRYSMVILSPLEPYGYKRMLWDLPFNAAIIPQLDSLPPSEIILSMPKFTIDYTIDLVPILRRLGLNEVFTDEADLSELIGERKGKVSGFVHKSRIEVSEKGTVAASATATQIELLMLNQAKPRVVLDHPFFFFIRDVETGFIFEGQLIDAEEAQKSFKEPDVSLKLNENLAPSVGSGHNNSQRSSSKSVSPASKTHF